MRSENSTEPILALPLQTESTILLGRCAEFRCRPVWVAYATHIVRSEPVVDPFRNVQIAQRWILAALRHRTFFALADLNAAIRVRLDAINDRPLKALAVSRRVLVTQLDRPALRPLPAQRYELAQWKPCRVNIDYHVEVAHNYYSVPYQLVPAQVDMRATASTIEVFAHGRRGAAHARLPGRGQFATQAAHMPHAHAEWTPCHALHRLPPNRAGRLPSSAKSFSLGPG
jgi:hypothetical protein